MNDSEFFNANPMRQAHIRKPRRLLVKTTQRSVHYQDEFATEFGQLAVHKPSQRRVLVWRVPPDSPAYDPDKPQLLAIPYILLPGETVEDTDDDLLPLISRLMEEASRGG